MLKLSVVVVFAVYSFACAVQGENMNHTEPPPKPQHARLYPITVGFSEGLAAIRVYKDRKDKWGYIDKSGKVVIEPQFAAAGPFSQGRAMVGIAEPSWSIDYKWGFIATEGRWIAKPQYESANEFSEGLAPVLLKNKVGFIDHWISVSFSHPARLMGSGVNTTTRQGAQDRQS